MVLVDTSVWVDHLRFGDPRMASLLEEGDVVCHPFIIGELACGHLPERSRTLRWIHDLPRTGTASQDEVMGLIEAHQLMSMGLGFIDVHLLASARLFGIPIWTRDAPFRKAADRLGVLYSD